MLQEGWTAGTEDAAGGPVVAGDVAVYRDGIAQLLHARAVARDSVGDASLVVLCPNEDATAEVELLAGHPGRRVVVVGVRDREELPCLQAGAISVLGPEASPRELRETVERAARGVPTFSPATGALVLEQIRQSHRRDHALTRRELEIAELIGEGLANKEIAARLFISVSTVKKHVHQILRKLKLPNRHALAGWIPHQPRF